MITLGIRNHPCHLLVLFYLVSPIPLAIARKCGSDDYLSQESSALLHEICYFLSACIVVSGFGLPFVLARRHVVSNCSVHSIQWTSLLWTPMGHHKLYNVGVFTSEEVCTNLYVAGTVVSMSFMRVSTIL